MISEQKKAFDVSSYASLHYAEALPRIHTDLKCLSLETSTNHSRITTYSYLAEGDSLTCPDFAPHRDILEYMPADSATTAIREKILHADPSSLVVWISPGPEDRITLHHCHTDQAGNTVSSNFGIALKLSPDECLSLANRALLLSDTPHRPLFNSAGEVAATPLRIPLSPDATLACGPDLLPLPGDTWYQILSGQADRENLRAFEDTQAVAEQLAVGLLGLSSHTSESDYIRMGARAEEAMVAMGYRMDPEGSNCGASNRSLLSLTSSLTSIHNFANESSVGGKYVKNCGECGFEINKRIRKGYHCPHCNGEYQGC